MKTIIKSIATLLLLLPLQVLAVGTLDLSGDYIRIGVSDYGTIGSKGNTSPGILYDNTGTGTFNTAYDYLTPGSPFEGWTVAYNGSVSVTNNNTGYGNAITGGVLTDYSGVAYAGTTFDNRAVWTGSHADFDLLHDVRFNNNQKFIDITTVLDAKVAMTDLYFARFTDPDARAAAGDSSRTTNTLGFSPIPSTQVVFSEALVSKYALGLYSAASNVGAGISSGWSTNPTTYYTGTNNGDGDYTIGLGFYVPTVAIGDRITFQYAYIFGPSTLDAGATAVVSGAGGGTAGVVPGCVSDCEMPGVTPSGPTLVSTTTESTATSTTSYGTPVSVSEVTYGTPVATAVDTYAKANQGKTLEVTQTITTTTITPKETVTTITTPVTVTTVTTPVTVETYSDASVVRTNGTPVTTTTTTNDVAIMTIDSHDTAVAAVDNLFSTRIDQRDVLQNNNKMFNQQLLSNAMERKIQGDHGPYLIFNGQKSNTSNTYDFKTTRFGLGYDKIINDRLIIGGQINTINSDLNGFYAGGRLNKVSLSAYSIYDIRGWNLVSDIGYATNTFKNNHAIPELGLYNNAKSNGSDIWLANRLYTPDLKGFRPFVGVKVQRTSIDADTESGSALTAVTYNKVSNTDVTGLYGVRYDKQLGKFNLAAEIAASTDSITNIKAGVNFKPGEKFQGGLELVQQRSEGFNNNVVSASVKYLF